MIVITAELWPFGNVKHKRLLGRLVIWNDGEGTPTRGSYWAALSRGKTAGVSAIGRVVNYPRKQRNVWHLAGAALRSALGNVSDKFAQHGWESEEIQGVAKKLVRRVKELGESS